MRNGCCQRQRAHQRRQPGISDCKIERRDLMKITRLAKTDLLDLYGN